MRADQAALDFQQEFGVGQSDDNGLERHITATRRQNFLCPPRRHRAFPLLELAASGPRTRRAARPGQESGPGHHRAHHARR